MRRLSLPQSVSGSLALSLSRTVPVVGKQIDSVTFSRLIQSSHTHMHTHTDLLHTLWVSAVMSELPMVPVVIVCLHYCCHRSSELCVKLSAALFHLNTPWGWDYSGFWINLFVFWPFYSQRSVEQKRRRCKELLIIFASEISGDESFLTEQHPAASFRPKFFSPFEEFKCK